MKPIPISKIVPPATGFGGFAGAVYANRHDPSGNFQSRPRARSVKRRLIERDPDSIDHVFDITEPYPRPTLPERPGLDMAAIEALMFEAAPKLTAVKKILEEDVAEAGKKTKLPSSTRSIGELCMVLYSILEAVCEKGVKPLSTQQHIPPASNTNRNQKLPETEEMKKRKELKKAMETAERSTIVFNLNLGTVPTMNKNTLNNNFSHAVLNATNKTSIENKTDTNEAKEIVDDMLSCAKEITFPGQATQPYVNDNDPNDPMLNKRIHTLPVKLEFETRTQRINFEKTFREKTGLKAAQSIPPSLKKTYKEFSARIRSENPRKWVMVRTNSKKLRLCALMKAGKEDNWKEIYHKSLPRHSCF